MHLMHFIYVLDNCDNDMILSVYDKFNILGACPAWIWWTHNKYEYEYEDTILLCCWPVNTWMFSSTMRTPNLKTVCWIDCTYEW